MAEMHIIVGHGIDIVDIGEFSKLVGGPMNDYLGRHFTPAELAAAGDSSVRVPRLAGRFAVKEAVLKALGSGWGNGIAFTDVEVVTLETGEPTVLLRREVAELASQRAIGRWLVSISHTHNTALASVIAIGGL